VIPADALDHPRGALVPELHRRHGQPRPHQHPGEPARPGPDTHYASGEPIAPAVEERGQTNCTPIVGWRFVLGDGIASPSVGPWGSLSQVTDPDDTQVATQESVLDVERRGEAVVRARELCLLTTSHR
jgi:hypothetical protein